MRVADNNKATEIYLSTHKNHHLKRALRMVGLKDNPMNMSALLKYLRILNITKLYKNNYKWSDVHPESNECYSYLYSYKNERSFLDFVKNSNLLEKLHLVDEIEFIKKEIYEAIDEDKIKIGSRLYLHRPHNLSVEQFEAIVKDVVYEKYPMIADTKSKINEINKYYDRAGFKISFDLKFTWNSGIMPNRWISKISIRATNPFSSLPKTISLNKVVKDSASLDKFMSREDIVKKYNFNTHYDVNGSVPRITYSLNNGYWLKEDQDDIYNEFLKMFENNLKSKYKDINKIDNFDKEDIVHFINESLISDESKILRIREFLNKYNKISRSAIKKLFMYVYFDLVSSSALVNHITRNMIKPRSKNNNVAAIGNSMIMFKEAVENVIGRSYGSEIFLHESCIYLDVTLKLLKAGYKCWLVYDCWYIDTDDKNIGSVIEQMIEESFNDYVYKYYDVIYR